MLNFYQKKLVFALKNYPRPQRPNSKVKVKICPKKTWKRSKPRWPGAKNRLWKRWKRSRSRSTRFDERKGTVRSERQGPLTFGEKRKEMTTKTGRNTIYREPGKLEAEKTRFDEHDL